MKNSDCIFCKIVSGEISSYKIYEDDDFIGILDVFPNTKGMTLVIPKEHYNSYAFEMPEEVYSKFFLTAKKVGKMIDQKLGVVRTALVMEGMGVNHAHIKLYPLHGLDKEFKSINSNNSGEPKFFQNYQGSLSTAMGPKASDEDLKQVQKLFLS